jgi:hypothetical protein
MQVETKETAVLLKIQTVKSGDSFTKKNNTLSLILVASPDIFVIIFKILSRFRSARGVDVEHRPSTPGVLGSIPGATKNLDTADCVVIYSVNHLKTQLVFTNPLKLVPA